MMNPTDLNLFYEPKDRIRLTIGEDRSYMTVKPVWSAPLSQPGKYLSLLNAKGDEIVMVKEPQDLPASSWEVVQEELHRRYLTAEVHRITHAKVEFGATYWSVITNRGERDFVTQSLQENALWLSEHHLMLIDVDGNRFDIPNTQALDARSREYIHAIL
jgi:hypothetical protein